MVAGLVSKLSCRTFGGPEGSERMGSRSYPPLFRHATPDPSPDAELERPPRQLNPGAEAADIPVIDLRDLKPDRLSEACRDWGVFRLINHGVPPAVSAQLQAQARTLLSLPFEDKQARFTHPVAYFWGTPVLTHSLRSLHWVEGLHVPLAQLDQSRGPDEVVDGYSSFRCLLDEYGRHMSQIARRLFDALALILKLNGSQLASYLSESDAMLRVLRYPCCPQASKYFGMDAHTDSSVLSIVNQDEVGGLQILHEGRWFDIAPVPNTLIVNLGDMMQAISSNMYKSVEHRVLVNSTEERISLCYFVFPVEDSVIVSSNYKAFTYKEFRAKVQEDIRTSGFKVGLERFRTGGPN